MDPITHGLLGAVTGQVSARKKLGNKAILVGAAAAMAPDLDIFIRSANNPSIMMFYHRNFTHALSFIPLGGAIIALLFLLCFKSLRAQWPWVFLAAILAYATHGLLDACTSYGTMLYWPFSNTRVAWDLISIIDPAFTMILFLGVGLSYIYKSSRPALIALILALLYLAFGFWQHARALEVQHELAASRKQVLIHGRVLPEFATLFSYTSIYTYQNQIYLDGIKTPLIGAAYSLPGVVVNWFQLKDLPAKIKANKTLLHDYKVFNWFCDGYVTKIQDQPLVLGDMRYIENVQPLIMMWGIQFPENATQKHAIWAQ